MAGSPFALRVRIHWELNASRWGPAFSFHLRTGRSRDRQGAVDIKSTLSRGRNTGAAPGLCQLKLEAQLLELLDLPADVHIRAARSAARRAPTAGVESVTAVDGSQRIDGQFAIRV